MEMADGDLTSPKSFGKQRALAVEVLRILDLGFRVGIIGVGIRGTLGDIDPLNKVPLKRARSRFS